MLAQNNEKIKIVNHLVLVTPNGWSITMNGKSYADIYLGSRLVGKDCILQADKPLITSQGADSLEIAYDGEYISLKEGRI